MEAAHAAGKPRRARAFARNFPKQSSRQILLAALNLFAGRLAAAEKTLAGISRVHLRDSDTQDKISMVYEALVAGLDYKTRMGSPYRKKRCTTRRRR